MSTVPEVVVAAALGLEVLGLSLVTNRVAYGGEGEVSHAEVLAAADRATPHLARLLEGVLAAL